MSEEKNSIEEFNRKREVLDTAAKNLKQKFVGLDDIIDDIISKIQAWYLFPEVTLRPLIINLWGMTGVGKTDLIRNLIKELGMKDVYMEIQMSNKDGSSGAKHKSMRSKLIASDIETGKAGILLLDEIQRFRSIDEDGREIHDYDLQDLWMLLSDGKFGGAANTKGILLDALMDIRFNIEEKQNRLAAKAAGKGNEWDDIDDEENPFAIDYWEARRLRKILPGNHTYEEIMKWDLREVAGKLKDALMSEDTYIETDFSKLLIFISGNLDEAFRNAANVSDADQDADEVHKRTKRINMITVKDALTLRFKPEQISRMGNIHIIYPSLAKDSFEKIIQQRLRLIEERLEEASGVKVHFDNHIAEDLYNNGVFPTQGVRPLLSTIDDFTNRYAPNALVKSMEKGYKAVHFSYLEDEDVIEASYDDGVDGVVEKEDFSYIGILDEIRNKRLENQNIIVKTSVHEAGHAIVYAVLYGLAPTQLIVNTTSEDSKGVTFLHDVDGDYTHNLNYVCMALGGLEAEKIVFGDEYVGNGGGADIKQATNQLSEMVRRLGHSDKQNGMYVPETDKYGNCSITNFGLSNQIIEEEMKNQKRRAKGILLEHKLLLSELSDKLKEDLYILPEDFVEIAKKHDVTCKAVDSEDTISREFVSMYDKWAKEMKKDEEV